MLYIAGKGLLGTKQSRTESGIDLGSEIPNRIKKSCFALNSFLSGG